MEKNQNIHCIVNNCHYWSQDNQCRAEEILVTADRFGADQPEQVDAKMATQLSPTPADTCMATCCKTFVSKGDATADGVKKMS